jgi:cyclase
VRRRDFVRTIAATSGALALARGRASAAQNSRAAGLHELRRNVGNFVGPGGTIGWLATPDAIVIIDSQFPATARTCLDALRQRSRADRFVLINTHHHGDHTAGNVTLRGPSTQIIQHERCAAAHRQMLQSADAAAKAGLADVTFTDRWSADIGDERVTAIHYGAAHTGGDAAIVFERANVVHLGDLVFNRVPPFVDRASGASIRNWIQVLETVLRNHGDATFIFGHGAGDAVTGGRADVAHFRDYLSAALEHVQRGIAAGRSLEEIAGIQALPGFIEFSDAVKNYPSAFPRFTLSHVLTAAHQELTGL